MTLIAKQFHLGGIKREAVSDWDPAPALFCGIISLGLPTIGSPARFHYAQNGAKNKQGKTNVTAPVKKRSWRVLRGVSAVSFHSWLKKNKIK